MTENCRRNGCRMFGPGTSERMKCKLACHDEKPRPKPSKQSLKFALLLAAVGGFGR